MNKTTNLLHTKTDVFIKNRTRIKQYNQNSYEIIHHKKATREKGWEEESPKKQRRFEEISKSDREKYNEQNILRAKRKIREYSLCNKWDYFVTLTFDRKRIDATNINAIYKAIRKKFKNYKKQYNDFIFVLLPELHKDKKHYHLHGLVANVNHEHIREHRPLNGRMRYNWSYWEKHFGYTSFIELDENIEAVSKYITKYMTKEISNMFGNHRYLVSRTLKKPAIIYDNPTPPLKIADFENEYIQKLSVNSYENMYAVLNTITS